MSIYQEQLEDAVVSASEKSNWDDAVLEWDVLSCEEDPDCSTACICGKENLRYLFTIENRKNKNKLYPIGSSCIQKFAREDLRETTAIYEALFRLQHAVNKQQYIALTSEFFSRKLLKYLYQKGAFVATRFNHFDGKKDYLFMLDMFNKREKLSIKDQKKVNAIIVKSIIPFLSSNLHTKKKDEQKEKDILDVYERKQERIEKDEEQKECLSSEQNEEKMEAIKSECKSCEYFNLLQNQCVLTGKKGYERGVLLIHDCKTYVEGHWDA